VQTDVTNVISPGNQFLLDALILGVRTSATRSRGTECRSHSDSIIRTRELTTYDIRTQFGEWLYQQYPSLKSIGVAIKSLFDGAEYNYDQNIEDPDKGATIKMLFATAGELLDRIELNIYDDTEVRGLINNKADSVHSHTTFNAPITINANQGPADWIKPLMLLDNNMNTNNNILIMLGKYALRDNCAVIGYRHNSDYSLRLGFHTYGDLFQLYKDRLILEVPITATNLMADNETRLAAIENDYVKNSVTEINENMKYISNFTTPHELMFKSINMTYGSNKSSILNDEKLQIRSTDAAIINNTELIPDKLIFEQTLLGRIEYSVQGIKFDNDEVIEKGTIDSKINTACNALQTQINDKADTNHTHSSFGDITVTKINNRVIGYTEGVYCIPVIRTDTVMNVGKYIDFYDLGATNYTARLMASSTSLTCSKPIVASNLKIDNESRLASLESRIASLESRIAALEGN
jgi:hypothetical protein